MILYKEIKVEEHRFGEAIGHNFRGIVDLVRLARVEKGAKSITPHPSVSSNIIIQR